MGEWGLDNGWGCVGVVGLRVLGAGWGGMGDGGWGRGGWIMGGGCGGLWGRVGAEWGALWGLLVGWVDVVVGRVAPPPPPHKLWGRGRKEGGMGDGGVGVG